MTVQRWNDEMLDELASTVTELRESTTELRESVTELREGITEVKDSVDGLRITAQALLQVAAQSQSRMDRFDEEMDLLKQRQAESDQRFNVLLEEVRFLIRGNQAD
jgi:methyl-accepting chemotaxis protein